MVVAELEYYLVDRRRNGAQMPQPPRLPDGRQRENQCQVYSLDRLDHCGAVLDDIARLARLQGLPTEGAVAESAPGQFEINLAHSDQVLQACDQAPTVETAGASGGGAAPPDHHLHGQTL